jgi:hypothetical protein
MDRNNRGKNQIALSAQQRLRQGEPLTAHQAYVLSRQKSSEPRSGCNTARVLTVFRDRGAVDLPSLAIVTDLTEKQVRSAIDRLREAGHLIIRNDDGTWRLRKA